MVETTADLEILLQHAAQDDPLVWEAVVRVMAPEVRILARVTTPDDADSESIVARVFSHLLPELGRYPVGMPFRSWFYQQALRTLRRNSPPSRLRRLLKPKRSAGSGEVPGGKESTSEELSLLRELNRGDQLLLTLHLVLGMNAAQIAEVYGVRGETILARLERAGTRLLKLIPGGYPASGRSPETAATHRRARRSGFQRETLTLEDVADLDSHLEECPACRHFLSELSEFANRLRSAWTPDGPDSHSDARAILAGIQDGVNRSRGLARINRLGKEVVWVLSAALTFLALGWAYSQLNPPVEVQTALESSETPTPPSLIEGSPRRAVSIQPTPRPTEPGFGQPESSWDPAISADGNWVAFASTYSNLVPDDTNQANDIFIIGRQTNTIDRISVDSQGMQPNNGSFEPSVSGDGRLVAFTSWADNLAEGDRPGCELWGTKSSCPDVFVHDRQTGETILLSRNSAGEPGDNFSIAPQISSDGHWVMFWSAASDLVAGDTETCGLRPIRFNCLDIFAYELATDTILRLPVGREFEFYPHYYNLSVTEGGRWILFQLDQRDHLASQLDMTNPSDLYIYDRDTGEVQPVNINATGETGNKPAYAGAISADGRWVVFSSDAENLVPQDTNEKIDIFLRNRLTGAIRRISLGPEGQQLFRDSGVTNGREGWLADGLAISSQGRWVLYLSDAASIPRESRQPACNITPPWGCQNLMLYDRETELIKPINLTNVDVIPFANLSADGSVAAFMARSLECTPQEFCQDIYLYEREGEMVSVIGRYELSMQRGQPTVLKQENELVLGLHERQVTTLAFSPDSQLLASGSRDQTVALYSLNEHRFLERLEGHPSGVTSLEFSPDGRLLAVGLEKEQVYLWRMPEATLQGVLEMDRAVQDLAFSPDGRLLAIASSEGLAFWDFAEGLLSHRIEQLAGQKVVQVAYNPAGNLLAAATPEEIWLFEQPGHRALMRLSEHQEEINALTFVASGRYLASASDDRTANVWRIVRSNAGRFGASLNLRIRHGDWVTSLAPADGPMGPMLATGSFDNTIGIWDPRRGTLFAVPYRTTQNQVLSLAFSPTGTYLAAGTVRGEVHLWQDPWNLIDTGD